MLEKPRNLVFHLVCRLAIPLWLCAGAVYKLVELNPKLLPPPVFKVVQSLDGLSPISTEAWLDTAMRGIVVAEFILVSIMLTMPRLARRVSIGVLGLFCVILLMMIVPEYQRGGMEAAWKGSCGCFGASGPSPVVMLAIDSILLVLALTAKRSTRLAPVPTLFGMGSAGLLSAIALAVVLLVPARAAIDLTPEKIDPQPDSVLPVIQDQPNNGGAAAIVQPDNPPVQPAQTAVVAQTVAWPGLPAKAAPYYVPEFAQWVNQRLDAQELARLMTPTPPAAINSGTWFVLFYREDCEHCHELMQRHFIGELATPTLAIAIPDTDPAASLEMPCTQCQVRSLVKGPEYVLTTPVLMRVENGIVTRIATDPEDLAMVESVLAN